MSVLFHFNLVYVYHSFDILDSTSLRVSLRYIILMYFRPGLIQFPTNSYAILFLSFSSNNITIYFILCYIFIQCNCALCVFCVFLFLNKVLMFRDSTVSSNVVSIISYILPKILLGDKCRPFQRTLR